MTDKPKSYCLITGKDDAEFCYRVSKALDEGYVLYGEPKYTYNEKEQQMYCAQAVIVKK